jgi:hypothetical protein
MRAALSDRREKIAAAFQQRLFHWHLTRPRNGISAAKRWNAKVWDREMRQQQCMIDVRRSCMSVMGMNEGMFPNDVACSSRTVAAVSVLFLQHAAAPTVHAWTK